MDYSIIIDFDGTITTEDVSEHILRHFAKGNWKEVEDRAIAGEISMDQCMIEQYGMIRGDPDEIMAKSREFSLRDGFKEFYKFTKEQSISMICVSAGLSFIIEDVFEKHQINIPLISPRAKLTHNGVNIDLVDFNTEHFVDFKHAEVTKHRKNGNPVIYIGDGTSDFGGIQYADTRFTVEGSSLSNLCKKHDLDHYDFTSFDDILEYIKEML